jgi:multiple sugar transport system substrate-binding protein
MPKTTKRSARLQGITWNHSRGFLPMVATAQRFCETHPGVEIVWQKRTLQEFADYPISKLAQEFDLLVIDHPCVGYAARHRVLLPLDEHLSRDLLLDQERSAVGSSFQSYVYDGHTWALAIDAAAPVSCWRPDLLERLQVTVPTSWDELLDLAKLNLVVFPAIPIDALMNFYMLCCSLSGGPFSREGRGVQLEVGEQALNMLRELVRLCSPEIATFNPIAVYEALASSDSIAYCPFAFGYSNYARKGYAKNILQFGDLCPIAGSEPGHSTLGGAGLAISTRCQHRAAALEYASFIASAECQRGIYVQSGGQPGHRSAWLDLHANCTTHNYFRDTLPALDRAYLRPRYEGYIPFQDQAAHEVYDFLRQGGDAKATIRNIQALYERSDPSGA